MKPSISRFDVTFLKPEYIPEFEDELGYKHTDGTSQGDAYICAFRPKSDEQGEKLIEVFKRFRGEIVEEGSRVECWIDLEDYLKLAS